ncbi:hypothetical protein AB0941_42615, partial [Streptomyces sp. NPDC013433]|uniref:hypothetical protein n=1 Tax=Streptomyces sp. NPDC013433 TaxID=3155604 RepID=UPI003453E03B
KQFDSYMLPTLQSALVTVNPTKEFFRSQQARVAFLLQEHYEAHRNVCHWGPTFDGADTAVMPEGDHERVMAEVVKDYRVVVFNWLMGR